jgi:hypothetical protein
MMKNDNILAKSLDRYRVAGSLQRAGARREKRDVLWVAIRLARHLTRQIVDSFGQSATRVFSSVADQVEQ